MRWIRIACVLCLICVLAFFFLRGKGGDHRQMPKQLAPVRVAKAKSQDVPYFLQGIGTVLPSTDVLIKSRVSGQLMRIYFREGQHVKAGELLAEIDPRPFEAALHEARGKLAADLAQLENARRDLARYANLVKSDFVERQKYDTQKALVAQLEGAVAADRANCETARLQLEYSRITAPSSGIAGLKKVDVGNQISSSDTQGIVRISEVSPCDVLFTLPETEIAKLTKLVKNGSERHLVQAWDREQKNILAKGYLLSLDNEIDVTTGTVKLKARFANKDRSLYPNQFVNARLCVAMLKNAVTIPASALQLGAKGVFVYVVAFDDSKDTVQKKALEKQRQEKQRQEKQRQGRVSVRFVTTQLETPMIAVISEGISDGEYVVVDGVDRLREGSAVSITKEISVAPAESL